MQVDKCFKIGKQNIGDDVDSKMSLKINNNELRLVNSSTKNVCLYYMFILFFES